jgi:hypothetical protein
MNMFTLDLLDSEAQANAGAKMHVINPETGENAYIDKDQKKPVTITFLGTQSDEAKKYAIKEARRKIADKKGQRNKKADSVQVDDDVFDKGAEATANQLTALVIGWDNMPADNKGGTIPFSKEKAKELFLKFARLRSQADSFISDELNFIVS